MNAAMIKSVSNPRVVEGQALVYTVELTGSWASPQPVTLDISGGAAVVGSDYQRDGLEVSYDGGFTYVALQGECAYVSPGVSKFLVRLATVDDALREGSGETVLLTAAIGSSLATGTGTIVDNDHCAPPGVASVDAASAVEGDALVFKVNLNPPPREEGKPIAQQVVELKLGNGTAAVNADYGRAMEVSFDGGHTYTTVTGGKVSAPGQAESFLVRVKTVEDTVVELDESMTLTASSQGQSATGTGTIKDDDGAIIKVADASVTEGKSLDFVVLVAQTTEPKQVSLKLSAGTAAAGADYKEGFLVSFNSGATFTKVVGDSITVPANTTKMVVRVDTIDDKLIEQAETVTLEATLNGVTDSGLGTINDNEARAFVESVNDASAIEGNALTFHVKMSEASAYTSQVQLELNSKTATAGVDFSKAMEVSFDKGATYVALEGDKVNLPANTKDFLVRVASIDDTSAEGAELFELKVTAGGKSDTGIGKIVDNETKLIEVGDAKGVIEGRALDFIVRTDSYERAQTIELKLHDGTARLGSDYKDGFAVSFDGVHFTKISGNTVEMPPHTTYFHVRVQTINDNIDEGNASYTMELEATLSGHSDKGQGVVIDEDWVNWHNWANDPMVIDLNGDGKIQTLAKSDGVQFDMTDDGVADRTGWIAAEDGFLVHDDNANGEVDNHSEMFGGNRAGEGYEQLSAYDSNRDGSIDAQDEGYQRLRIWQDKDIDGFTDQGELLRLSDAGIRALSLQHQQAAEAENGNILGNFSDAETDHGTVTLREAWFDVDAGQADPQATHHVERFSGEQSVTPVAKPYLPNLGALFNDVKVAGKDQDALAEFSKKGHGDEGQDIGSFDDSINLGNLLHRHVMPGE